MTAPTAREVDLHVGVRFRQLRKARGLSQHKVAEALGLTFQQVQKYERGINRISASKLYEAAQAMEVDVRYFFEGLPSPGSSGEPTPDALIDLGRTTGGIDLARTFPRLRPAMQRQILQLALALDEK
jgi:transcriptional regulator with XRE-family HTH domain